MHNAKCVRIPFTHAARLVYTLTSFPFLQEFSSNVTSPSCLEDIFLKEQANKFRTDALAPCLCLCFMHKEGFSAALWFWPKPETCVTSSLQLHTYGSYVQRACEHEINMFRQNGTCRVTLHVIIGRGRF